MNGKRIFSYSCDTVEQMASDLDRERSVDGAVLQLFALVSEALAGASHALLGGEVAVAQMVIDRDSSIDELVARTEALVWERIDSGATRPQDLRRLVGTLLILPELERSADLAEHIAQRARAGIGGDMTPLSRGVVQRMTEVGLDMWRTAADAYQDRTQQSFALDEADEEMDILHERLTSEVASGAMAPVTAAQVTLLARFYERLGDHAVNLARRIGAQTVIP